jgi:hypothetical protein
MMNMNSNEPHTSYLDICVTWPRGLLGWLWAIVAFCMPIGLALFGIRCANRFAGLKREPRDLPPDLSAPVARGSWANAIMSMASGSDRTRELRQILVDAMDVVEQGSIDEGRLIAALRAFDRPAPPLEASQIEWVVNSAGELGVKVGRTFAFLYKGRSLQYDQGSGTRWRHVGKREFGECCHPRTMPENGQAGRPYTVGDGWLPLGEDAPQPKVESDFVGYPK